MSMQVAAYAMGRVLGGPRAKDPRCRGWNVVEALAGCKGRGVAAAGATGGPCSPQAQKFWRF